MSDGGADGIIIVLFNSVKATATTHHGHHANPTPTLDTITDEAITYRRALTSSTGFFQSLASIFTGFQAHNHRLTEESRIYPESTIIDSLNRDTTLFTTDDRLVDHPFGFHSIFDTVIAPRKNTTVDENTIHDSIWVAEQFEEWIDEQTEPWLAVVNFNDTTNDFTVRPEHRTVDNETRRLYNELPDPWEFSFYAEEEPLWKLNAIEQLYIDAVNQTDAALERVLNSLSTYSSSDDTALVITSLRGMGFGEQPQVPGALPPIGTSTSVHEALTHVPLVVKPPGYETQTEVDRPVSTTEVAQIIEKLANGMDPAVEGETPVTVSSHKPSVEHVTLAEKKGLPRNIFGPGRAAYFNAPIGRSTATIKYEQWIDKAVVQTIYGLGNDGIIEGEINPDIVDGLFDYETQNIGDRWRDDIETTVDSLLVEYEQSSM